MAILLMRYSEIGLKGIKVRNNWENRLKDNIIQMFSADGVEAFVIRGQAPFFRTRFLHNRREQPDLP